MNPSGCEWVVEALGCDVLALADLARLQELFDVLVRGMALHPVEPAVWHQFPGPGGITGMCLLAESHLACHTFPEYRSLCLNVFCCRVREDFDFAACLQDAVGATEVRVRKLARPYNESCN